MTNSKQLLTLLPLAALLGGCPIFIDDGHPGGSGGSYCDGWTCIDAPNCDFDHACPAGWMCDFARQTCIPPDAGFACESSDDCLGGSYCEEGACAETGMCGSDDECASLGPNLICDPARSTCIPATTRTR